MKISCNYTEKKSLLQCYSVCVCSQTQWSRWAAYQGTLDYTGKDFTASATLANPNVLSGSGVLALQYLQSMTKR